MPSADVRALFAANIRRYKLHGNIGLRVSGCRLAVREGVKKKTVLIPLHPLSRSRDSDRSEFRAANRLGHEFSPRQNIVRGFSLFFFFLLVKTVRLLHTDINYVGGTRVSIVSRFSLAERSLNQCSSEPTACSSKAARRKEKSTFYKRL